jgi:hypothetical protein
MLQTIRNAADHILFRVVLVIIVIAFAFWGIQDNLSGVSRSDLVTFKDAESITTDEFLKAKSLEISRIQKMSGAVLSEDDIQQINKIVLEKLVTERLLNFVAKKYDLNFDDKTTAYLIKLIPAFHNKNGEFDIELLKASARNIGMNEEEFSEYLRKKLMQNLVLDLFASITVIPKALVQNIVDFMSKECSVDVVALDLKANSSKAPEHTDAELEAFYKEHIELFTIPEKRSISYIVISPSDVKQRVVITQEEAQQFYDENKEEFGGRSFAKARTDVENMLVGRAISESMSGIIKNLEDDVASGSSIQEIAEKFKFSIKTLRDLDVKTLAANKDIGAATDTILAMQNKELSYPLELPDDQGIALVTIDDITPQQTPDFRENYNLVLQKWQEEVIQSRNIKIMQDFIATSTIEDFKVKALTLKPSINKHYTLARAKLTEHDGLPPEMLVDIFNAPQTPYILQKVYKHHDKIFASMVTSLTYNKKLVETIVKASYSNIEHKMREGMFLEMMSAIREMQDVRVNETSPVLHSTNQL